MKREYTRFISFVLAVVMILGMLPQIPYTVAAEEGTASPLEGKTISILGDSISTYTGVSNNADDNSTISSNKVYYSAGTLGVFRADTWWQQTIDALGLELLVNNSWSGSCILNTRSGTVGAYIDRCVQLHNNDGEAPDIIAVFMGTNDFSYYQSTLGTADIDYDTLITDNGDGTFTYAAPATSCEAYAIMLHKMTQRYENAEIYCMTLTARRDPDKEDNYADVGQPTAFNESLAEIAGRFGCTVVDLENCGIDKNAEVFDLYMGDARVHPNAAGMDKIAEAMISALMGEKSTIYNVSYDLENVLADTEKSVTLGGAAFTATLTLPDGCSNLTVCVTMGGADITDSVYSSGRISIPSVTGDLVISAAAEKEPASYRWEFDGTDLVSVASDENTLTKQGGSVSDGKLMDTYYRLDEKVFLRHDRAWVVEWKASGAWSGMLFSAQKSAGTAGNTYLFKTTGTNGFMGFGERVNSQYQNYGIALGSQGVDTTLEHTYRLENRIASDGSNMVYLLVDGVDYGAMNHYFIGGSTDQGTTVDWISGKDLKFSYIGASGHAMNNCAIDYIAVWEEGVPAQPETLEGKTISILGASISTFAGTSNGAAADTTNSTIRSNAKYYPHSTVTDVTLKDTWWMQAAEDLGLRLLVNNSWSGSSLLHERNGTVGAYVDRCVQLHDDTGDNAGEVPDIIGIQMGTNDFQYYKDTLGTANIDYDALITANGDGTYTYATPVTSLEAAAIVLHKISVRYPSAEVYYLNISQRVDGTDELIRSFNAELKQVVEHFGAHIADIYGSAITMADFDTYIGDGRVHPNCFGMDAYTEAFKAAVLENTAYQVAAHKVSFDLEDVRADYGTDKLVVAGDSFTCTLTPDAGKELSVSVTMGGEDVTASCYENSTIAIDAVTADVVITANGTDHIPQSYRWEYDGTELVCVSGDNDLTKNAGTTTDGVFNKTRYALETSVQLLHDQPWVVEWKSEGTWKNTSGSGGRMFTSDDVNAHYNARYIFKSSVDGLIAMGEKTTTGSHNYGIALSDHGIDGSELHTYRLENRIADDGTNMIYLYVDGAEIGPMVNYYVGTTDQETTSDWLSGKDFVFPYMGTDTHGFTNCSIEYIQVWEGGVPEETAKSMSMRYDDHLDMTGKLVEIVDAGTPTSYKVGYGVADGTLDDTVVTLDGDTLVATGIGTAQVRIDGQLYEVSVTAAPISLILLAGQSNMQGSEGNADQSIVCEDGQVYATYGDRYTMTTSNATNFAPSALTGEGSTLNVNGTTTNLEDWPVYLLNEAGAGKAGPDSGFAYEWVKQTGEKVWVVNAAHGGSSITTWQKTGANYKEAVALFSACQQTLQKEIDAGHFTLSHMGYFWCQGCTDYSRTAEWYVEKYLAMHENFKTELAFDHDSDSATADKVFEFGGIIPVRAGHEYYTSYRQGVYTDTTTAKYHESFKDLRFTGPRVAQYWMGNNPDLPDIWNVCNIGESWVTMPDGTDGVAEYFQSHYENGTVDYTTQVAQKESWYTPTTPAAVHDSIHYNQIGYNEVGRESVRNALIMLGEIEAPETETIVEFLTWDGYTPADEVTAATAGSSGTLVVPVVYPVWKSKEVTYQVSEGLNYEYYDLLADTTQTTGTLTADGVDSEAVNVVKADPYSHFTDHLSHLPENVCCGLNLWNALEHDKYYYTNGSGWGIHSSGTVYSVTIPIDPGDKIYASSFGAAGTNGSSSSNGIRVTFFSEYGVAKTMAPSEVYPEFTANGGYLVAPEGAVAVNIPMWTNSDQWELYILNREHDKSSDICSICGKDSHTHTFSDWKTVTAPSIDGPGEEKRTCACGETETREVEGVWQTMELSEHMSTIPESYCSNTNLWPLLEHDEEFFSPGTQWHVHNSGNVYSVTIPLKEGDKIFATSFGKGGENGGSANGIRVTFFDAYGVAKTLAPADTYAEFTANGGYLTAPEGTIAVNVPMWNNSDDNELYILNREHDYESEVIPPTCTEQGYTTHTCSICGDSYADSYVDAAGHSYEGLSCTICGAQHPNAANFEGKVISILGDSISTFAGYIPVADGFNLEHIARYPQDNLLTDVNETWWMQVIAELDAKLGINESWRSTEVYNYIDEEVNSTYDGTKACMASTTRIQNLGSNGTPDVILFYGGTNDITQRRTVGTFDPATVPAEVDLTSVKWDTVADAYVTAIMRMQYYYPDAQIIAMLPTYTSKNTEDVLEEYNSVFAAICEYYGVTYVDLRDCGITTADLPDGTHPDAEGMDYITDAVLDTLLSECEMTAGEHIVHSVNHELTGAESSLGYYKGVSDGKSFVTTITGEDLTVTVTMGGVDITASVYAGGVVNIPSVTGDIVITADGVEKPVYADHLQQLPEYICPGVNLWTALEPENVYYTASGWGNLANDQAWSVTIPVAPGDCLWATSFQARPLNGNTSSSSNGIRVTWFDADGVLKSMSPSDTYAEFTANGYITAPEGAVAVNIPMWNNSDDNELYILNQEHTYKSAVTDPICTEKGYTTHTCTVCGDSFVDSYVDAAGHTEGEAIRENEAADGSYDSVIYCTVCGEELSREHVEGTGHLPGDINGDGSVNNKDVTRLFQYLSGWDVEVVKAALDVNGDGSVNNKDVTRLFQYLSGWDVEIH